jgi:hypothetical protein
MGQAVRCLGILGRAPIAALSRESISFRPYTELINKETEVIGVSDHLASEPCSRTHFGVPPLVHYSQVNAALDALERSTDHVRTVIVPAN